MAPPWREHPSQANEAVRMDPLETLPYFCDPFVCQAACLLGLTINELPSLGPLTVEP